MMPRPLPLARKLPGRQVIFNEGNETPLDVDGTYLWTDHVPGCLLLDISPNNVLSGLLRASGCSYFLIFADE